MYTIMVTWYHCPASFSTHLMPLQSSLFSILSTSLCGWPCLSCQFTLLPHSLLVLGIASLVSSKMMFLSLSSRLKKWH